MKTFSKILMLVAVFTFASGFVGTEPKVVTENKTIVENVYPSDTFWDIAQERYCYENEKISFEEFMYNIKHLEANRKTFFNSDGSPRMLQAGDKITFVIKVKVQKDGE